ncbi:MAG: pyridoxamine 5'-phosphate oxidase family protein [Pseudomonas sp.]|uniref:2Fe-2S iron-sulfur cluster-binding protein n=1 Tax=Pseudomonas sp. TaxID=306 RepID=UPI00339B945B
MSASPEPNATTASPWHAGEKHLQAQVGVSEGMERLGRQVIRDHMPEQHRAFYRQLPFLLYGSVNAQGAPWTGILEGPAGFIQTPDARTLRLDGRFEADDPAAAGLAPGAAIGLLGIELHSRRRNRVNGQVTAMDKHGLTLAVSQAFGNCPQYIQRRVSNADATSGAAPQPVQRQTGLDAAARGLIGAADTFFVSSYVEHADGSRAVDCSHRGGQAGFVKVEEDCLTIPDFAGNLHFNTLGNLLLNPRAGLLFIDFVSGELLQLSGSTELILEGPQIAAFQGAERLWRFRVEQLVRRPAALSWRGQFQDYSPNSLMTGSWPAADARLRGVALGRQWRPLRVTRVVDESARIRSFYLEPADQAGVANFQAGQHLTLRLPITGQGQPLLRSYSLSSAPSAPFLRISVQRDGQGSRWLHEHLAVGSRVAARAPQGGFTLDGDSRRPLVLLSAGVGVTPLLAMLREVLYQNARLRRARRVWWFQGARRPDDLAFVEEVDALQRQAGDHLRVARLLSQAEPGTRPAEAQPLAGRIDIELLKAVLPFDDFDFYLCGPSGFTQELYDGLRALNIDDARIHTETFGPSGVRRQPAPASAEHAQALAATSPVPVQFQRSAKTADWTPASGTLLDLAQRQGLTPAFSCRSGSCGSCATRLLSGQVHYPHAPALAPAEDEVLICCAIPADADKHGPPLVLEL